MLFSCDWELRDSTGVYTTQTSEMEEAIIMGISKDLKELSFI
jgi:hypothetical protein